MIQSQQGQYSRYPSRQRPGRHPLLQHHPVLFPLLLLGGSVMLSFASFSGDTLFPLFALIGLQTMPLCLSIAFVLGISGILITIIGLIERTEQHKVQAAIVPQSKEQSYAHRH